jgi:hypothetical protein
VRAGAARLAYFLVRAAWDANCRAAQNIAQFASDAQAGLVGGERRRRGRVAPVATPGFPGGCAGKNATFLSGHPARSGDCSLSAGALRDWRDLGAGEIREGQRAWGWLIGAALGMREVRGAPHCRL